MNLQFYLFLLLCIVNVNPVLPLTSKETFIAIGNTGLGKSFTARLFGFTAEEGHSVNSMTRDVTIHENENYQYIDTPGFDDSDVAVEDENTKLDILFEMQKANITFVHTILWFVKTDTRATQSLKKQARFINELAMNSKGANVWDNTIVIFKGMSESLHEDPIKEAIRDANNNANQLAEPNILSVYLYEKLKPNSPFRDLTHKELCDLGIYKDKDEIRDKYKEIIRKNRHTDHPVQIVFADETCVKCGIKIDKRLSGRFPCHTNEIFEHGDVELYNYDTKYTHTGQFITVGDSGWELADKIVNSVPLLGLLGGIVTEIGKEATNKRQWSCCGRDRESRGCREEHSTGMRYTCCHKDAATKPPGCKKVCESCHRTWGNTKGCTYRSQHVFVE